MKCWSKRLAFFTAGLGLLFVLFIVVERLRGELALSARLNALRTKGEVLSVAELKPIPPASDQNVFAELLRLTNRLALVGTNLDIAPPSLRITPLGSAVVVVNLDKWKKDGKETNDWQSLGLALEPMRETLTAIKSATQKPAFDSGIDYKKGFVDLELAPIALVKQSCQLLSRSVLYSLKQGNLEETHQDLCALVTLTAKQTPEPLVICQLVRQACAAIAFNTTWQALQSESWNDAQLASLQAAWQPCDFVKDMAFAMEMERAMTLDFYAQIRNSQKLNLVIQTRQKTQEATDGLFGTLPTRGIILTWIHVPIWRAAWRAQDELASLEQWQFMIERERLARTNGWVALDAKSEPEPSWMFSLNSTETMGLYDRLRFLFASEQFSITDVLIRKTLIAQTQQQMALTVLGIQRYRLRNGKLPQVLSALVPEYLAVLPVDFMDGKTLRYRVRPDNDDFLLYSVGEDGKDDGGDPTQQETKKSYRQLWGGLDAIWPTAATAEESRLAM